MQIVITHIRVKREIFYVLRDQIVAAAGASQFDHHIISFIPKIRSPYIRYIGRPPRYGDKVHDRIDRFLSQSKPTLIVFT